VWVFHKLPGLGAVERGEGDAAFWAAPPAKRSYVIEVDDDLGRFLPFQLPVDAPVRDPAPGDTSASPIWTAPAGVPLPEMPPGMVPLFSTANRTVTAGMAVIRADLWDPSAPTPKGMKGPGGPAAWAVVTATIGGAKTVLGIANARGCAAL